MVRPFKYRIGCLSCDRTFVLDEVGSPVPRHSREGDEDRPEAPYIACPSSSRPGLFLEKVLPDREGRYT